MTEIRLSKATQQALNTAREKRDYWAELSDDDLIHAITLEFLSKESDQTVNEWLNEFF